MKGRSSEESKKRRPAEDQIMPSELDARPPHKRPRIPPPRPPCSSSLNCFVRAVGYPLVEYKEPVFDWEMADDSWEYWDFCPSGADLTMRDKDPASTFEADKRRLDEALERMQRKVDLEQELHKAYPFLSENALAQQGLLHQTPTGYSTNSLGSAEEQSQESTSVPVLGLHPDDQLQSSISTQPPILFGSERDELQNHHSENCLCGRGPRFTEMQQNFDWMTMPMAGPSSSSTFSINSDPEAEMYLVGSQPMSGHMPYLQSANTHNSALLDDDLKQPILTSGDCNQQCLELSLVPDYEFQQDMHEMQQQQQILSFDQCNQKCLELSPVPDYEFQQNMPEMQQQQLSWSLSRNSMIACDQQQQSLPMMMMPASGGANCEQHNFWCSDERVDRWQHWPSTPGPAPGIRACSSHLVHEHDPRLGVWQRSGRCDHQSLRCSQPGNVFFHSSF